MSTCSARARCYCLFVKQWQTWTVWICLSSQRHTFIPKRTKVHMQCFRHVTLLYIQRSIDCIVTIVKPSEMWTKRKRWRWKKEHERIRERDLRCSLSLSLSLGCCPLSSIMAPMSTICSTLQPLLPGYLLSLSLPLSCFFLCSLSLMFFSVIRVLFSHPSSLSLPAWLRSLWLTRIIRQEKETHLLHCSWLSHLQRELKGMGGS